MTVATDGSLLAEVERDLLDGKPLADLLRKCLMLGGRSGSQDLQEWARTELRGYAGAVDLPSYRIIVAPILLDATTGSSWIKGQSVPASALPDFAREAGLGNEVDLRQGVGELAAIVADTGSSDSGVRVGMPGSEIIGEYFDRSSGNPFQHTDRTAGRFPAPRDQSERRVGPPVSAPVPPSARSPARFGRRCTRFG